MPTLGTTIRVAAAAAVAVPAAVRVLMRHANETLCVTEAEFRSPRVPDSLDGYRIAQVSDLHDKSFGRGNERLNDAIDAAAPDMVAITGDLIHDETIKGALSMARHAASVARTVYVPGNHESYSARYDELLGDLAEAGVTVLRDAALPVWAGEPAQGIPGVLPGDAMTADMVVLGLDDYAFLPWDERRDPEASVRRRMTSIAAKAGLGADGGMFPGPLRILLAHRPELFGTYADCGADLVLAGHAHGGQWRLPLLGGLYAPSQGVVPKYAAGMHTKGGCTMVVSRGLGNSGFPLRLNNHPELVVVTLRSQSAATGETLQAW